MMGHLLHIVAGGFFFFWGVHFLQVLLAFAGNRGFLSSILSMRQDDDIKTDLMDRPLPKPPCSNTGVEWKLLFRGLFCWRWPSWRWFCWWW
jgi:hypothetical protein